MYDDISPEEVLEHRRKIYKISERQRGEEDPCLLRVASVLTNDLLKAHHTLEAERLITKAAARAAQVHENEYALTKSTAKVLQKCQVRKVWIVIGGVPFRALRYEDDGEKCVVQGPISTPRNTKEEDTFVVATEEVGLAFGTLVICHGLEGSLSRFNGKIGDLGPGSEESDVDTVYFEDADLGHCSVQPANVRILFELPY